MKETKSIKLSAEYCIKPKQLRDSLVMTAREYRKTPEYQKEAEKKLEDFKKMLQPQLESFEKMAKQINEQLASSGFFEAIKKAEEVYSSFLKSYQPEIRDAFISPRDYSRAFLTNEDIDAISEKAAEKVSEIIKKNNEFKNSNKWLTFYTKDNVELKINKENGDVILGETEGNIAPGTQEYKILLCLLESSSYIAEYRTLLKLMYPNQNFEKPLKTCQVNMWALNTVIRNIKRELGILPRKNAINKDIFRTLKKHKAYSLSLKD